MKKTIIKSSLSLLGILSVGRAMAQANDSLNTNPQQELIPVEVRAVRVNDKSPYAVSNLNQKEIKEQNLGQDIPYILNQTPSVVISSDAGAGVGYTGLRIRGTDASRINFTINGIPVNDAESQAAIFVDFPDLLSSTNSIQVQRGVGSSTNGAGAFGASVNLSNLEQGNNAYAEANNTLGSYNTWKHTVKAGTGLLRGGFNFDVRASKISSNGYIERSFSDLKSLQFTAGWQSKNERTRLRFNLFTGKERTGQAWNGVAESDLDSSRRRNTLGLKADGTYYDDQTDNYQQDYYQLFFDHNVNSYWSAHAALFLTRGKGFYNEYRLGESYGSYYLPDFTTPGGDTFTTTNLTRRLWLDNYYYGGIYSLVYQRNKTQFILGGGYTRYDAKHYGFITWADYGVPDNYRWYNLTAYKKDCNIYAKLQQRLGSNWFAFADLQYRRVHYEINGFRKNPGLSPKANYNFINPKVGLSYITHHAGNAESKAYGSFAVANKEPNRDDFEASPTELPKAESLYDAELGYQYRTPIWEAAANLYYMYYRNQLIPTGKINDVGSYTRTNTPKSYRSGIELTASVKPADWLSLHANATFSANKILDFEEYIDDYDAGGQKLNTYGKTDIALSPSVIAAGNASLQPFKKQLTKQQVYVDLIGKYVGRQFLDNTGNKNRSINPYALCDLRLRYNVQPGFVKDLGIALAVNNVLNKKYEASGYTFSYIYGGSLTTENYYFPQAGTNFLLAVNIGF
ncbi:MAG: TonB-dependent receptor plug domain-containing protein [Edaphocola sp.]